jgi:hypothetical protein
MLGIKKNKDDFEKEYAELLKEDKIQSKSHEETVNDFEIKISRAQTSGDEWVETSAEIMKYMLKCPVSDDDFFHYKGVKVCAFGKRDEIEKKHAEQLGKRLHGPQEGTIMGTPG